VGFGSGREHRRRAAQFRSDHGDRQARAQVSQESGLPRVAADEFGGFRADRKDEFFGYAPDAADGAERDSARGQPEDFEARRRRHALDALDRPPGESEQEHRRWRDRAALPGVVEDHLSEFRRRLSLGAQREHRGGRLLVRRRQALRLGHEPLGRDADHRLFGGKSLLAEERRQRFAQGLGLLPRHAGGVRELRDLPHLRRLAGP
jgi:hypothetical protein